MVEIVEVKLYPVDCMCTEEMVGMSVAVDDDVGCNIKEEQGLPQLYIILRSRHIL